MKILVACEFSGTVRDAFRRKGHDAMSCDLLPSETPGPHHQGSVTDLMGEQFDLVVAHPPCTYLAASGMQFLNRPGRWQEMQEGAAFFWLMSQFNSPRIAIENPIQHRHAIEIHGLGKPTQYVQPYMFGHTEQKKTGLWLTNLPKLVPTDDVGWQIELLPKKVTQRMFYLSPGPDRQKLRSKTYPGIAEAMAEQWGAL